MSHNYDIDYLVIGSGFGGSISALRLAEKGYSVTVLEAGKRFAPQDFPSTNWKIWKYFWLPKLFLRGFMKLTLIRDVLIASGAGVGGGSLVYANTSLEPPAKVFDDPKWPQGVDWRARLAPFYDIARRMLGITRTPFLTPADQVLKAYAEELGRGHTFHSTDVAVYFGKSGETVPDPFFAGEGPARTGCKLCGGCMVGCRHNAKNTLDKNYLFLAERRGVTVLPERQAVRIEPLPEGGYLVEHHCSTALLGKDRQALRARGVVLAAGVLGTVELLLRCKQSGALPKLSDRLGDYVRTNSEAILAVRGNGQVDYSTGIAITSGIYVDDHTHIEPVRYPKGSDVLALLATLLTDGGGRVPRQLRFLATIARHPLQFLATLVPFGWARRTIVLLVMQTLDNSMRLVLRRSWLRPWTTTLTSSLSGRPAVPTYIKAGNDAARAIARRIGGIPQSAINEVLLDVPTTAHILGGCPMGNTKDDGVVDAHNHVFGYDDFYVIDGSMVPANLGVNPSLTIAALAEHAMSHVPPKAGAALPPPVAFSTT